MLDIFSNKPTQVDPPKPTKVKDEEVILLSDGSSKFSRLAAYPEIRKKYFESLDEILSEKITLNKFFKTHIQPFLVGPEKIEYINFYNWHKLVQKEIARMNKHDLPTAPGKEISTYERERQKKLKQANIRQEVTELMNNFVIQLSNRLKDPKAMQNMDQKEIESLYKLIRQEEDRAKELELKERAEDRADAEFALMLERTRAGQVTLEDIEFLEADIRESISLLPNNNGVYQLPDTIQKATVSTEALISQ